MKSLRPIIVSTAAVLLMTVSGTSAFAAAASPHVHAAKTALSNGPAAVNLGTAGGFAILAQSGISTTGVTSVDGDIGVSPIDSTAMTGFAPTMDSSGQFSTSTLVTGKAWAANYADPTPAKMTAAIGDMGTAYGDAAGRTNPTATELDSGLLSGDTISPGLYKWSGNVGISGGITLSGGPNAVWIFQIAGTFDVNSDAIVSLAGGAQASQIFWQVAGQTTLQTGADLKGNVLDATAVVMKSGAHLEGRALAQTAVTLIANTVTKPVPAVQLTLTGRGHQVGTVVGFHWTVVTGAQPASFTVMARTQRGQTLKMNTSLVMQHVGRQYTLTTRGVHSDIDSFLVEATVGTGIVEFGRFNVRG